MHDPYYHVDAFADGPFTGNPAGVCLLSGEADATWMQNFAFEMNLSEVAYLAPCANGWSLRWFTPAMEVRLCGHATLASAHVLWEAGRLPVTDPARFSTKSGWLTAYRQGDAIRMDFPSLPVEPAEPPPSLLKGLGLKAVAAGKVSFLWLVEVEDEAALRAAHPDFQRLSELPVEDIIITARSATAEFDFVSRCFAPAAGINEDPVTGSAHCALGPYWAAKLGKTELRAYQASRRGGVVGVKLEGDRVWLSGKAVTVTKGEIADQ